MTGGGSTGVAQVARVDAGVVRSTEEPRATWTRFAYRRCACSCRAKTLERMIPLLRRHTCVSVTAFVAIATAHVVEQWRATSAGPARAEFAAVIAAVIECVTPKVVFVDTDVTFQTRAEQVAATWTVGETRAVAPQLPADLAGSRIFIAVVRVIATPFEEGAIFGYATSTVAKLARSTIVIVGTFRWTTAIAIDAIGVTTLVTEGANHSIRQTGNADASVPQTVPLVATLHDLAVVAKIISR